MLHYGKKNIFWSFIIFVDLSFTTVQGQKIGFNSCECINFLNIANFHVFHVCGKRLSCNDTTFFLHFFSFSWFCNSTFFHSGYIIKPPQPSSAITELRLLQTTQKIGSCSRSQVPWSLDICSTLQCSPIQIKCKCTTPQIETPK